MHEEKDVGIMRRWNGPPWKKIRSRLGELVHVLCQKDHLERWRDGKLLSAVYPNPHLELFIPSMRWMLITTEI